MKTSSSLYTRLFPVFFGRCFEHIVMIWCSVFLFICLVFLPTNCASIFQIESCANGLEVKSSRKRFWGFSEKQQPTFPVLSDIFSTENTLHAVFNVKRMMCNSCSEQDWGQFDWTCRFSQGNQTAIRPFRDPDGNSLIVSCKMLLSSTEARDTNIPKHVSICAEKWNSNETIEYNHLNFCMYPTRTNLSHYKYNLAGCTSIQGDAIYRAPEWIVYHLLQGWQHFYIYINESPNAAKIVLARLILEGFVDVIDYQWPQHDGFMHQQSAENSCILRYRGVARWVSMTDVDEYVQPLQNNTMSSILHGYHHFTNISSLQFMSVKFGLQEAAVAKPDLQLQDLHLRQNVLCLREFVFRAAHVDEHHMKSIVQPSYVHYFSVHAVTLGLPRILVDPDNLARLVHYKTPIVSRHNVRDTSMCSYAPSVITKLKQLGFGDISVPVTAWMSTFKGKELVLP